jgi:hypothetical protein
MDLSGFGSTWNFDFQPLGHGDHRIEGMISPHSALFVSDDHRMSLRRANQS